METSATPKPLHLPAGLAYECIQCGRSCGEFWEIPVEPDKAAAIRALPLEALSPARDPRQPIVESPWTPGGLVMRLEGGRCCMQQADGLCSIHAAFGLAAKPHICHSFPYRFVETPDGAYAGLSFACTAVLKNLGPPLAEQQADLAERYATAYRVREVKEPLNLTESVPISWAQYAAIEADLEALLEPALGPIGQRLVMQSIYLRLLLALLLKAREQAGSMTAGPEANDAIIAVFRRQMRGTPESPWPRLRALAVKRGASPLVRRMFLGFAHALRNTYGQRRGRLRSYLMVVGTYLRCAGGRGVVDLPLLKRPVRYGELRRVRFDPTRPEFDELLTRYFRHRLFRKDLALGDTLRANHSLLLMQWGLIHWYAAAQAAAEGQAEVSFEHLVEAVRNVEKYFVFHSTFDQLFSRYPMLRGFIDRVFEHPLYAFSMGYTK